MQGNSILKIIATSVRRLNNIIRFKYILTPIVVIFMYRHIRESRYLL